MKRLLAVAALLQGLTMTSAVLAQHHVTGRWEATAETPQGIQQLTFDLVEADGHLTGTVTSGSGQTKIQNGTVDGTEVSFTQPVSLEGREVIVSYVGTVNGDEIAFTRSIEGRDGESDFVATRVK